MPLESHAQRLHHAEALGSEVEFDAVDIMLLHNQHEAAALGHSTQACVCKA